MSRARTDITIDPRRILKALASLRAAAGSYPAGHPTIVEKLADAHRIVREHLHGIDALRIDIIHGVVHLNGVPFAGDGIPDAPSIGVDSVHIAHGVESKELLALAEVLGRPIAGEPFAAQLARRGVERVSVGRLVALDTRWSATQWPEAPTGPLDPDYEESLRLAQGAFDDLSAGRPLDTVTVRDLVQLLICRVASSHAALAQILTLKRYENLTYCHSVNVAVLSLLLGRQLKLDQRTLTSLVEAALLHDVGKTRVPLDILKKPGALDKRERRLMEAHTTFGAEILVETEGLQPLTPLVALEHHRTVSGGGYPDLGAGVIPHAFSQIVSVADIYEAVTGARSYQSPALPERACLLLARLAGDKLNAALVKALVNAITFFPVGSVVRTSLDEVGVVTQTTDGDPLHPVIALLNATMDARLGDIDTTERDAGGAYRRHIVETLTPPADAFDVTQLLRAA